MTSDQAIRVMLIGIGTAMVVGIATAVVQPQSTLGAVAGVAGGLALHYYALRRFG